MKPEENKRLNEAIQVIREEFVKAPDRIYFRQYLRRQLQRGKGL